MIDRFEYIERYFNDGLMPPEKEAFEKQCLSDAAFAREVAVYVAVNDHLKRQWRERTDRMLNALKSGEGALDNEFAGGKGSTTTLPLNGKRENDLPAGSQEDVTTAGALRQWNGKKGIVKVLLKFAAAAAIIAVAGLAVARYLKKEDDKNAEIGFNNQKSAPAKNPIQPDSAQPQPAKKNEGRKDTPGKDSGKVFIEPEHDIARAAKRDALFAENFEADAVPPAVDESLKNAFDRYRDKDYEGTIAGIDKALQNTERSGERTAAEELTSFYTHYYKAQSYLALGKAGKALPELKAAIDESPDRSLKSKAQWYLALACLKQGNTKDTQKLLNELGKNNSAGKYKGMAENLRQQIRTE